MSANTRTTEIQMTKTEQLIFDRVQAVNNNGNLLGVLSHAENKPILDAMCADGHLIHIPFAVSSISRGYGYVCPGSELAVKVTATLEQEDLPHAVKAADEATARVTAIQACLLTLKTV